jgi:predicted enzyme related to lactoylglutathione lyase
MVRRTSYPPGAPCWIDLATTDPEAAREFYGELFGWSFAVGGPEVGGYTMCLIEGDSVAGMAAIQTQGMSPVWSTYLATADVDATAEVVREAGGEVVMAPLDVLDQGRLCFAVDAVGAPIGFWQPRNHVGSARVAEHGAMVWNEHASRDLATAEDFYATVVGWEFEPMETGGPRYALARVGGEVCGGLVEMTERWGDALPHWMVYFHVDAVETAHETALGLGATEHLPLTDTPFGRFTVISDPQGAVLTLIQSAGAGDDAA